MDRFRCCWACAPSEFINRPIFLLVSKNLATHLHPRVPQPKPQTPQRSVSMSSQQPKLAIVCPRGAERRNRNKKRMNVPVHTDSFPFEYIRFQYRLVDALGIAGSDEFVVGISDHLQLQQRDLNCQLPIQHPTPPPPPPPSPLPRESMTHLFASHVDCCWINVKWL